VLWAFADVSRSPPPIPAEHLFSNELRGVRLEPGMVELLIATTAEFAAIRQFDLRGTSGTLL